MATTQHSPLSASKAALHARPSRPGVDPRGPRFGAGITAALLLVTIGLALPTAAVPSTAIGARIAEPGFVLLALITALFTWGAFAGVARHPYGWLFRRLVRPRLAPPTHLEDPVPPTFAQGIGLVVTIVGVVLHLAGVPFGLAIPAAAAFIAAFLNSAFDYCFGCQIYLLLARIGIVGRASATAG
ncbi:DUF4395 domain-containing protein [Parafrigoribacterium soli]|uniref:DUF4395 domain-containing protein n=1 Tax=Parafrigoribacterium soli TaxID=3144663 RepID=UPI0032EEC638